MAATGMSHANAIVSSLLVGNSHAFIRAVLCVVRFLLSTKIVKISATSPPEFPLTQQQNIHWKRVVLQSAKPPAHNMPNIAATNKIAR